MSSGCPLGQHHSHGATEAFKRAWDPQIARALPGSTGHTRRAASGLRVRVSFQAGIASHLSILTAPVKCSFKFRPAPQPSLISTCGGGSFSLRPASQFHPSFTARPASQPSQVPEFETANGPASERTAGEPSQFHLDRHRRAPSQFSDRRRVNCHCRLVASGWPVLARKARSESSALPATVLASEQQRSLSGGSCHRDCGSAVCSVSARCYGSRLSVPGHRPSSVGRELLA